LEYRLKQIAEKQLSGIDCKSASAVEKYEVNSNIQLFVPIFVLLNVQNK